jgi:hypothetical protein
VITYTAVRLWLDSRSEAAAAVRQDGGATGS